MSTEQTTPQQGPAEKPAEQIAGTDDGLNPAIGMSLASGGSIVGPLFYKPLWDTVDGPVPLSHRT